MSFVHCPEPETFVRQPKRPGKEYLDIPCIQCKNKYCRGYLLKEYIEKRCMEIAEYIIRHDATVRQTAKAFGVSKSTVHKDITERLQELNPAIARQARQVLDLNKAERHIRGGMATKKMYDSKRKYHHETQV